MPQISDLVAHTNCFVHKTSLLHAGIKTDDTEFAGFFIEPAEIKHYTLTSYKYTLSQ